MFGSAILDWLAWLASALRSTARHEIRRAALATDRGPNSG